MNENNNISDSGAEDYSTFTVTDSNNVKDFMARQIMGSDNIAPLIDHALEIVKYSKVLTGKTGDRLRIDQIYKNIDLLKIYLREVYRVAR